MLLLRSSSDSDATCSMPIAAWRRPCRSISRLTAVSAIDTTSSSSSHAAHSRIISPSVYLPLTLCATSSCDADTQWRGTYTSSAWMPARRDTAGMSGCCGLGKCAQSSPVVEICSGNASRACDATR
eukprot:7391811-Prymnesium_polylepis.1